MSQIVEMNELTVEQKNGKVWVNGKLLTDERVGAKREIGLIVSASVSLSVIIGIVATIKLAGL